MKEPKKGTDIDTLVTLSEPLSVSDTQAEDCIKFSVNEKELLCVSEKGIEVNRANFPDFKPDDFVREFIDVLEKSFTVHFEKSPPEVRMDVEIIPNEEGEVK